MSTAPTAFVIAPDGSVEPLTERVTWQHLREHVQGYLETVALDRDLLTGSGPAALLWADEDGHSRGLEPNPIATALVREHSGANVAGAILGPVVVTGWHEPPGLNDEGEPEDEDNLLPVPLWVAEVLDPFV